MTSNSLLVPHLGAEIVPGVSAAGFTLGESFDSIEQRVGTVEWYEANAALESITIKSQHWIGINTQFGYPLEQGKYIQSFVYQNHVVTLAFGDSKRLFRIVVGRGYAGTIGSVRPGDDLMILNDRFELEFNSQDDDFLIHTDGRCVEGISFLTNYRASLEHAPDQTIEYVSVHNWSLR